MMQTQKVAKSSERRGAKTSSPECRMAALGLILRCLDRDKASFSSSYIVAPDGTRISFNQARDMYVSMIGDLSS